MMAYRWAIAFGAVVAGIGIAALFFTNGGERPAQAPERTTQSGPTVIAASVGKSPLESFDRSTNSVSRVMAEIEAKAKASPYPSRVGGANWVEVLSAKLEREEERIRSYVARGLELYSSRRLVSEFKPFCERATCHPDVLSLLAANAEEEVWLVERGYPTPGEYAAIRTEPLAAMEARQFVSPGARAALARRKIEEYARNRPEPGGRVDHAFLNAQREVIYSGIRDGSPFAWLELVRLGPSELVFGTSTSFGQTAEVAGYRVAAMAGDTWAVQLQQAAYAGPDIHNGQTRPGVDMGQLPRGVMDAIDHDLRDWLTRLRRLEGQALLLSAEERPGGPPRL